MNEDPNAAKNAADRKQETTPAKKPHRKRWRRLVRYILRKTHERRAEKEAKKANETPSDRAAKSTARATWWIAIFTIALAVVAGWTLREVIGSGADTKAMIKAAKEQACAASRFADGASHIEGTIADAEGDFSQMAKNSADAIKATQAQMRLEQRAWVSLSTPIIIDYLQLTPKLVEGSHFCVMNYGRGPAFKVIVNGWFDTDGKYLENESRGACRMAGAFSTGTVPVGPHVSKPPAMGYTLFPGQPHEESIGDPGDPWQGDAVPNLKHFWFVGCISYLDQFRHQHWTSYCMEPKLGVYPMDKNIPLQYCSRFNDTDDEPAQQEKHPKNPK